MRKIQLLCTLFVAVSALMNSACSNTPSNPVEYNNKLMTLLNNNDKDMTAMNEAMNAQDYTKAEEVRKTWEANLNKVIEKANSIGDFDGDDSFKAKVIEGLQVYKSIAAEDYKSLIELRSAPTKDEAAIAEVLNNINDKFVKAAETINKASAEFEAKYAKS